ncbi:hypothetical protein AAVH_25200 [Aphelenchoides avenae]|nr:hypothetical protein AAVH_25200 [Aphelenchus avenae]
MPRKRTKACSPRKPVEKKAKIELRQQVLPSDTLLDVFNFSGRRDLDKRIVVSRQYYSVIQRAQPLRRVEDVLFYYDSYNKEYRAVFRYAQHGRTIAVRKFSKAFKRIMEIFVSYLRFCFVRGTIEIGDTGETLYIGQDFVGRLKSIRGDYNCTKRPVFYGKISLMPGLDVFDLICAFPHYRTINKDTLRFLQGHVGLNDDLLRSLASRGIWSQTNVRACNEMHRSGMDGKEITEDGILDFAFCCISTTKRTNTKAHTEHNSTSQ